MPVKAVNFTLFIPSLVATKVIPVTSGCCCTNEDFVLVILDLHTRISSQGMISQYVLLVSSFSLLSTFSLNVLILLLSAAQQVF